MAVTRKADRTRDSAVTQGVLVRRRGAPLTQRDRNQIGLSRLMPDHPTPRKASVAGGPQFVQAAKLDPSQVVDRRGQPHPWMPEFLKQAMAQQKLKGAYMAAPKLSPSRMAEIRVRDRAARANPELLKARRYHPVRRSAPMIQRPTAPVRSGGSKAPSGNPVVPTITIPGLGGYQQMEKNANAIKNALGGRIRNRRVSARPRR